MDTNYVIRAMQAIKQAEADVAPRVGAMMGQDSAAAVYRAALRQLGHDTSAIGSMSDRGWRALWQAMQGQRPERTAATLGADAKAAQEFTERYPNAANMRVLG